MIEIEKKGTQFYCRINEKMTIYQAGAMRDELLGAFRDCQEMEVDLSQVDEIDSAGLQLLLALKHSAKTRQMPVHYINHSPVVVNIIQLFGVDAYFGDQLLMPSKTQATN